MQAMHRIARALRLSDEEWTYASLLADRRAWDGTTLLAGGTPVSLKSMQKTLDAFAAVPALLYDRRFDVLAGNAAARAVYGRDVVCDDKWGRNMIWRFFMDADRRRMYPDAQKDLGIGNLIGVLRMNWAVARDDDGVQVLVDELRRASTEFDSLWTERRLAKIATVPGRVRPFGSDLAITIEYTRFCVPDATGHVLAALVPASEDASIVLQRHLDRVG
jgi:hypothetical protein